MSAPDLDGRIAPITGAAGGIGQPLARTGRLARPCQKPGLAGWQPEALRSG